MRLAAGGACAVSVVVAAAAIEDMSQTKRQSRATSFPYIGGRNVGKRQMLWLSIWSPRRVIGLRNFSHSAPRNRFPALLRLRFLRSPALAAASGGAVIRFPSFGEDTSGWRGLRPDDRDAVRAALPSAPDSLHCAFPSVFGEEALGLKETALAPNAAVRQPSSAQRSCGSCVRCMHAAHCGLYRSS